MVLVHSMELHSIFSQKLCVQSLGTAVSAGRATLRLRDAVVILLFDFS